MVWMREDPVSLNEGLLATWLLRFQAYVIYDSPRIAYFALKLLENITIFDCRKILKTADKKQYIQKSVLADVYAKLNQEEC